MNKIKLLSTIVCALFLLGGCSNHETEGISQVLRFVLKGSPTELVSVGKPYVEPGYEVLYGAENYTNKVTVDGQVDHNTIGVYELTYHIVNPDGIKTQRSRKVIVCDLSITTDISGNFLLAPGSHRMFRGGKVDFPGFKVKVTKVAPGFFEVSDFFGGYYAQRAGYGENFAMKGYLQLKKDNSLTLLSSHIGGWGDSLVGLHDATYDAATGNLQWKAEYVQGMMFDLMLNKQ